MKVKEVMTTNVVTIGAGEPFKQVAMTMLDAGVSGLPVVEADGSLVGIVTEADLVTKEARNGRRGQLGALIDAVALSNYEWRKSEGRVAGELMSRPVLTVGPEDDLRLVARRMLTRRVKRLPVLDNHGRLVGIVSRADLLKVFDRTDEQISVDIAELLRDRGRQPTGGDVRFRVRDGVVTLRGTLPGRSPEQALVTAVREVPGVVDVVGSPERGNPTKR